MEINMKSLMKKFLKNMIKKDIEDWPPECPGWLYQPYRPKSQPIKNDDTPEV